MLRATSLPPLRVGSGRAARGKVGFYDQKEAAMQTLRARCGLRVAALSQCSRDTDVLQIGRNDGARLGWLRFDVWAASQLPAARTVGLGVTTQRFDTGCDLGFCGERVCRDCARFGQQIVAGHQTVDQPKCQCLVGNDLLPPHQD